MRIQHYLTCICLLLLGAVNLQAQTQSQYVGPNNGDWFDKNNWEPKVLPGLGNNAFIGGGVTVVVGSPLAVNFNITAFGNISATAAVTVATGSLVESSGTFAISSTGSLTNNGTLKNFGTMTFAGAAGFTNGTGATFTNSSSFTLQTTLVNQGAITNNGTIDATNGTLQTGGTFDNNQTLTTKSLTINASSNFTNNFGATLNITGATGALLVNGNFTNNGAVNASGTMTVNGIFNNNVTLNVAAATVLTVNAGAQLTNAGTLDNSGFVQNYGTFTNGQKLINKGEANNFATLNNNNLIDNRTGATFFNRPGGTLGMGYGSKILNAGTFDNKNAINSFGTIENNGTFLNNGTLLSFGGSLVDNNSTFTNNNSLSTNDLVSNDGTFTNNGTVNVNGGSEWTNNATFTNGMGGTVNVVQDFNNKATGVLTNNGTFRNVVRTRNEGSFTNNAFLVCTGEPFTNAAGATLTNNELFYLQAGNLLNEGTLVNTDKLLVDECSSMKNTGSINNTGGNFELHGILFQKGTTSGAALNNQGGIIHTAATSDAPSVCQNGTFGADINGDIKVYANALVAFSNFDSCANIVYFANDVARPVFHCSDIGTVQNVNLVVRTRLGDELTCVAQVTPVDLLEPQFNACPKDQVIFTPNSTVPATWAAPTATDNCSTVTLTATHTSGSSFPVGITGVTYTAKDVYNNTNQCQFRIDVRQTPPGSNCTGDIVGPTFTGCPSNQTIQRLGPITIATWTPPTPNDNCKPITLTATHVPGQGFPVGATTVTYTAMDGNNNSSTCTFTVTVTAVDACLEDTQKPNIFGCPANIWLPTNPAINGAVAIWNSPGAGDNCGVTNFTASHVPGAVFPVGTTTVTYTATDAANNASTCNFLITVGADPCPGDVAAPAISGCPANISLLTTGISATATWTAPTATDPCAPVTVNNNYSPGATFPLGVTPVTYQFSDKKGNKSTCSFTVTVQNSCSMDNVPPVITGCPANITVATGGASGATATWTAPTATDNCGLSAFTSSFLPGANFPIGTTTVVYTAIDLKGNASNCSFNVNVVTGPACTTNAAPINGTTGVNTASVALSWNSAANASSYDVYLGTANPPTTVAATNVTGTSTTVINLTGGAVYYWYVVPKNAAGSATGCASSVTSFTTSGGSAGGDCNVTLGSIVREIWNTNTWNLNSIDGFGNSNSTVTLTQFALTATENGSNYTDRVRGFIVPSATGKYTFNVTGDDYVELFLSTNGNPASKQKIAWHYGYTNQTQYTKYATQTSAIINLQAGQPYYIELRHLEGGGKDHFRVSWKTPSSSTWTIVPGSRLAPYSDIVTPNAVCQNITLQLTTLGQSVQINGQQVNGGSTPGCGATITSYNVSPTSFSQPGTYTATLTVTNSLGLSSTCTATVTVLAPPCTISNTVCEANVNNTGWQNLANCAVSVCVGEKVILSVNPNGLPSYKWSGPNSYTATGNSGGDALVSNGITAAQAGTYTVTMTDASGCTATKSIQVTVNACSNCQDNLLVNPGFENGTSGWTWMQNAGTTTASPFAETKSLKICSGSGGISQYLPALSGTTYTLKVYAKISGATGSVGLRFYDKNWAEITVPSVPVTATNYTLHTVTATAPVNAAYVESWAWKNTNGCFYADDFCLTSSTGFPACTNNLLANENPGFESNFTNWDWTDNASITTSNVHSGAKAAQVCTSYSGGGAGTRITAMPGATYSLQLWAKTSGSPDWAGAGIAFYDASWNKIGDDISRGITATDWSLYLIQGVAPINAKYVDFWFWKEKGGCLYVDDFCASSTGGGNSCNANALFVVGSTWLNSGDAWVKNRLESLGLNVTVKSATSALSTDANGNGVVIISSTINSSDVGSKFTNVAVPIVTWESYLLDNLKMVGSAEQSDFGQNNGYKTLNITDPSHPLSAGLSGNVQVYSSNSYMRWGWTTNASAAKVAKVSGQEAWYGLFGSEKGAAMQGGFVAPARRVSLFMDEDTPTLLTAKGIQLFDGAIEWAMGCNLADVGGTAVADRNSETATDLAAVTPAASVQVFPNPAEDKIFLEFGEGYNEEAVIRLFDISGKALKEWEIEASSDPVELQLDGLRSGQYLLWITSKDKAPVSKRIIVANTK
ncbi:MAG: HYR domain-containing protein [Saprospiraceae bacterium]|nr:HYR domain-containing protein [Saprospiraceae bacterium]